ncbi:DUF3027 domain-containing protein [Carbonactinospora thermoautotrophica]|uniref:DUF3027 domain-containing protein n=1 Tax=Carbonactinospora thermoautotrophica TaxID=1469144 RepID=UPI0022720CAE|nr:DUF3027 domain-containing protein [Carbonactinospora thermoautotrophica]MCX9192682.1 DUF3027 domain-containing protein [Carbonactinospora thermoautotrophica]
MGADEGQSAVVSAATRSRTPDATCAAAVDLALAAAEDVAGIGKVGRHLGVEAEGDRLVTHYFECLEPAYRGWRWAVTLARAPRAKLVTVCETCLLPGPDALLAPAWVPWSERLRPGDLGVGDLLPTSADDERLVPGYTGADEDLTEPAEKAEGELPLIRYELGLGRARVLSHEGRTRAAERWYRGEHGPEAPIAQAAPARCATCGFLAPLAGALGRAFGVCANEYSPSDGSVVSLDHGCGAHSEAAVVPSTPEPLPPIVDEFQYEVVQLHPEHTSGSVSDAEPAEDLGHS